MHQQSTVFKKYMERVTYVCGDHGHAPMARLPLSVLMQDNDVVVLTAQILVDALDSKQVSLKDIGLIVFDECHEAKVHSLNDCYKDILIQSVPYDLKDSPVILVPGIL